MTILPPNATELERAVETLTERIDAIPVPLSTLWDPQRCPVELLPWLAYTVSVDTWDPAWPEATKRAVIAASFGVHKVKGTIGALKRALAAASYRAEVSEWFNQDPPAEPYTFRIDVAVTDRGLGADTYREVERLALASKNARSHLTGVRLASETAGTLYRGAVATSGAVIEVLPYQPGELESTAFLHHAAATWSVITSTVYPEAA